MADVVTTMSATSGSGAAPVAAKPSTSKKTVKSKKLIQPAEHPKYREMIASAIGTLKERRGSSRQAILKYILAHYKVGTEVGKINARVKMALRAGIKNGNFRQVKGSGASGSFRLGEKLKTARPKMVQKPKPTAKKPASKKATKTAVKKKIATTKRADSRKKPVGKPKKSPAKKIKAKVAKSPAKKVAKKTAKPKMMAKKSPAKKVSKGKVSRK